MTEQKAQESLNRLRDLRAILKRYEKFRDKLEIRNLEGLGMASMSVENKDYNESDLSVPYKVCMPWVLDEISLMNKEVNEIESLFKDDERN